MKDDYYKRMTGVVDEIFISTKKGASRERIEEGIFKTGFGLVGDVNSGKTDRHVVILGTENRERIDKKGKKGLCVNRFHETIRVKNVELYKLAVGTKIMIGETIHEISYIGKRCFDECELVRKGNKCLLSSQVVFTKVINGGIIRIGDSIQVL